MCDSEGTQPVYVRVQVYIRPLADRRVTKAKAEKEGIFILKKRLPLGRFLKY